MSLNRDVISRTLRALLGDFSASYGNTYDSIEMLDGQTKPTESAFTTKYNELDANHGIIALRHERDQLLAQSDWIVIKEREEGGSVSNFAAWKTYRQALRDITDTYSDLDTVVWPTEPS